jgi:hypothetical protein
MAVNANRRRPWTAPWRLRMSFALASAPARPGCARRSLRVMPTYAKVENPIGEVDRF